MQDIQSQIRQLKRPGMLVQAARFGFDEFRQYCYLARLLPNVENVSCRTALMALLEAHSTTSCYVTSRFFTAIMAEARDLEAIARARSVT